VKATLSVGATRRFVRTARQAGLADVGLERIVGSVASILASPRFREAPLVPCHNDMHLHNVRYPSGADRGPVLLDWEAAGYNRAGSDLDRLFPEDDAAAAEARFGEALAAYAAALRQPHVDAAELALCAGAFALKQRMAKFNRSGAQARFETALRTWRRLERAASAAR
jgi:thiamine kinase-like enzyme